MMTGTDWCHTYNTSRYVCFGGRSGASFAGIYFGTAGYVTGQQGQITTDGTNISINDNSDTGYINFLNNSTEHMRLTSSGNLGIGHQSGSKVTLKGDSLYIATSSDGVILTDSGGGCWLIQVTVTTGVLTSTSITCPTN